MTLAPNPRAADDLSAALLRNAPAADGRWPAACRHRRAGRALSTESSPALDGMSPALAGPPAPPALPALPAVVVAGAIAAAATPVSHTPRLVCIAGDELAGAHGVANVATALRRLASQGGPVLAVVHAGVAADSASLTAAHRLADEADAKAFARVLGAGDDHAAGLLNVALSAAGVRANVLTAAAGGGLRVDAIASVLRSSSDGGHPVVLVSAGALFGESRATLTPSDVPNRLDGLAKRLGAEHDALPSEFDVDDAPAKPVRVAIAGSGAAARRLYERLALVPESARIVGVLARDASSWSHFAPGGPQLLSQVDELAASDPDVVVTVGHDAAARAGALFARARGLAVLDASAGGLDDGADAASDASLSQLDRAAAINEAAPALFGTLPVAALLEKLACGDAAPVRSVRAVLDGAVSAVTSAAGRGETFDAAVHAARRAGAAEPSPTRQLDGTRTAQRLAALASLVSGAPVSVKQHAVRGVQHLDTAHAEAVAEAGASVRLVGVATLHEHGVRISVEPQDLAPFDALAAGDGRDAVIELTHEDGSVTVLRGALDTPGAVVEALLDALNV